MPKRMIFNFEKLDVWQKSKELISKIYAITGKFPEREKFALSSQMQRAAVSVASNVAEGSSRSSLKDQLRFTEIAYGSLMELYCQLLIANDLGYIDEQCIEDMQSEIEYVFTKLSALRNSQQKRLNTPPKP